MKKLSYKQLSASMTAKERAKLVIKLVRKGLVDVYPDEDKPISTEAEIKEIIAASPPNQAKQYNYYIELKDQVWTRHMIIVDYELVELELMISRFHLYVVWCMYALEGLERDYQDLEMLRTMRQKVVDKLTEIASRHQLIVDIQEKEFDGMHLFDEYIESPFGFIPKTARAVKTLVMEFNEAATLLCIMCKVDDRKFDEYRLSSKDITSYIDEERLRKKYQETLDVARRKS